MKLNFKFKIFITLFISLLFFTVKANADSEIKGKISSSDFEISKITCKNAIEPLNIPTYVKGDNSVVHPSVLYFKNKWNGYKYWMAMTPYTNTNNEYENPSIVVSNDGIEWIEPEGISNPIVQKPQEGFNSDVNIFMDKNEEKMFCMWREVTANNRLIIKSSINGVDWKDEKVIIDCTKNDNASPCIIYEDGKYLLFSVDLSKERTDKLQMYQASSPTEKWNYIREIKIPNIPIDKQLWHFEIKKYGDNYIILYTIAPVGYYGGCGELYLAKSKDLVNWETMKSPLLQPGIWDISFYKSSFIIKDNDNLSLDLWYGTTLYKDENNSQWKIGFTKILLI